MLQEKSMVDPVPIALFATPNRRSIGFKIFVGPASETHIVLTNWTYHMVAALFLEDWNTAVATGFTKLQNSYL